MARNPDILQALKTAKADGVVRKTRVVVKGLKPVRPVKVVTIGCTANCHGCYLRDLCAGEFTRLNGPIEICDLVEMRKQERGAYDSAMQHANFYCKQYLKLKLKYEADKITKPEQRYIDDYGLDDDDGGERNGGEK